MPIASLQNGSKIEIYYSDEMWRSSLNGLHFCSQTLEVLIRSISEIGSSILPEIPEEPPVPLVDQEFSKLRHGKLEEKQRARQELMRLSLSGDKKATQYLARLPHYKPSWEAKFYVKQTRKHDFRDVTITELHEHVTNLVLRNKLIKELSDLLTVGQ